MRQLQAGTPEVTAGTPEVTAGTPEVTAGTPEVTTRLLRVNPTIIDKEISFRSRIYDRSGVEPYSAYQENSLVWIVFILFLIIGYLLMDYYPNISILLLFSCFIYVIFDIFKDWGKLEPEGKLIGKLIFTPHTLTFHQQIFATPDIKDIKIDIHNFRGHKNWHQKWRIHTYTVDSGTESSIEINVNGTIQSFHFQLTSNRHLDNLMNVLEHLYLKGINIKEYLHGERTYLLQKLNYKEIQEFKKKYNQY